MAIILDGKQVSRDLSNQLQHRVDEFNQQSDLPLKLVVFLVGEDPASHLYVEGKRKVAKTLGIQCDIHHLKSDITTNELVKQIDEHNRQPSTHGILVQLPLPTQIHTPTIISRISPIKDVDGFHPLNLGALAQSQPKLSPCTPKGIIALLEYYDIPISGKDAVIVGASNIVGRPMALELLNHGATITVCHKKTQDLSTHIQQADILVSAIGQPNVILTSWLKNGSTVIDVGITRQSNGNITGDIEFDTAKQICAHITPVPGGVGPMTIHTLMENTLACALLQQKN